MSGVKATKAAKDAARGASTGGGGMTPLPTTTDSKLKITLLSTNESIEIDFVALKSFSDSTKSNLESTQVFGRADPIKVFGSSNRTLTFGIMFKSNQGEDTDNTGVVAYVRFIHRLMYRGLDNQMVASEPPLISMKFTGSGVPNSNTYVGYLNECTFGGEQGLITSNAGVVSEKDLLANNILLHKKSIMNFNMDIIHTSYPGTVNGKPPSIDFWGLPYPVAGATSAAPAAPAAPAATPAGGRQ